MSHRQIAEHLLSKGSLFVHLDPRRAGVVVPPWLTHQPHLVLQFGHNMPIPIPDMVVGDAGIAGTLSFSRTKFGCNVPWSAVFALIGDAGRGMDWQENMPAELCPDSKPAAVKMTVLTSYTGGRATRFGEPKRKTPRGTLHVVPTARPDGPDAA